MAFNLIDAIIILFIENDELIKKNKDDLVISNIFKDFWKTYEFLNENRTKNQKLKLPLIIKNFNFSSLLSIGEFNLLNNIYI
jgi:hypothetical protein